MKKLAGVVMVAGLLLMVLMTGCGGGGGGTAPAVDSGKTASVMLSVDLSTLPSKAVAKTVAAALPITSASVQLTRTGFEQLNQNMTIANNIASCQIDNLAVGYWHVTVHIFSGVTEIYAGSQDANVIAGSVAQVNLLFDPAAAAPITSGSVAITAAVNPLPGYTALNQQVTKALFDEANAKLYIYDATTKTIGVYNANTMVRERDIVLASPPAVIAFTATKTAMLLGYSSGQLYKLELSTGASSLIGDVLMEIKYMIALDDRLALVGGPNGSWSNFKTLDLTTGQVLNTKSAYYSYGDLILNASNGNVYAMDINVSPVDIFRFKVDPTTGTISEIVDSIYHGDYSLMQPLRVISNGSRIVTASGIMFTSSQVSAQDLLYSGSIGMPYIDLAVDNAKTNYYLLSNNSPYKLVVLDQSNYFVGRTVDLLGTPKLIFNTTAKIIVITSQSGASYFKVFDKAELGL